MAIEYLNENNKKITERSESTYKPQSSAKNTVDNSNAIMYNKNKQNNLFNTHITDFVKQWKDKNQDALKYAGDSAKNSIDKGLKEAPDYMRDADEGTSFENIQTASVKRHLANDANDDKLHQSALMEIIGHLSKENKEPYLKHTLPLQTYIDAKDKFDFKQNNYTTTKNIDTTPDENVRQLQRELNEAGYTDKFGEPLKEDGIYAGKTAYADDSKKAVEESNTTANVETYSADTSSSTDNVTEQSNVQQNTSQRYRYGWSAPVRTGERPGEREKTINKQDTESISNERTYVNENGIVKWKELPYIAQRLPVETQLFRERKISTEVYNAFDTLSQAWYAADTQNERDRISKLSQSIRDNNYNIESCKTAMHLLYKNRGIITSGYKDGVWYDDYDAIEFGKVSDTYKILDDLNSKYTNATSEQKQELKHTGDEVRRLANSGTPIMYGQEIIMDLLHNNVKKAKEYQNIFNHLVMKNPNVVTPYTWFVDMTCSEWDYKTKNNWQGPYETFNGYNMNESNRKNWTPWIYFDGMLISADKLGNINLGYIGTKMGFSGILIKNGFTMDKDDGPYVEYGIKMAKQGR